MKQLKNDNLDYIAVKILKKLGIKTPQVNQIILVKSLFLRTATIQELTFDNQLTSREVACLLLAAKGQTSAQTADVLGLSVPSVETYRTRIKRKLKAANLVQALFEGIRLGEIALNDT
jgi:DNA-binding CsgD family transcriptional regulator